MSQLILSMVIHNHQPVGNYDHVFAEATGKAYDPLPEAVARHPGVRPWLHYSGSLLDCPVARRPDHLERLANLAAREQIEFLTGNYHERIIKPLSLLPI